MSADRIRTFTGRPLAAALFLSAALLGQAVSGQELAIVGVTVIDPASDSMLPGRTVLIDNGTIVSVTGSPPADLDPEVTLEGEGRFLLPGLWDAHVHLDMHTETDLIMLVAHGVLSVRDMGGDPFAMAERKRRIADGTILGPTIHGAGSILEDRAWLARARQVFDGLEHRLPVDNPEEARATIDLLASWGVDLVKIRNVTDRRTLAAILAAAASRGLTVAGHEPLVVDIDEAARLGMTTFEHLPFLTLTFPGREADEARLVETIEALVASGTYLSPTLVASNMLGAPREELEAAIGRSDDRYRYLPASVKKQWVESLEGGVGPLPWAEMRQTSVGMARRMHSAGVPLLAGTDMGVPLTFPGSSLHDEIELMAETLGLSPMEALRTATANPARLLGADSGHIASGQAADLVLLSANPLEALSNVRSIEAVVVRGEVLDRARLDELLRYVEENKDRDEGATLFEAMEARCEAEPTPACLERLAGYSLSRGLYAQAAATYERALTAGAGESSLEGLFASRINLLHADGEDCVGASSAADALLESHGGETDKIVGVLDRLLPALGERCAEATITYLGHLAAVDPALLSEAMRPIYREHYASYLARVEGDESAAYAFRVGEMPEGWDDDPRSLEEVATWCLEQKVDLAGARELARRGAERATTPIGRFEMMLLEARIASAAGDHQAAVALMETLDEAVPGNSTIQGLLETFRELAAGSAESGD